MSPSPFPTKCPSCGEALRVRALRCPGCLTQIEGDFALNRFLSLTPEQLVFCELFLRCRGSLKDVGAALNLSYPTVRARLDDLVTALGYGAETRSESRKAILQRLAAGEITADEALRQLDQNKEE